MDHLEDASVMDHRDEGVWVACVDVTDGVQFFITGNIMPLEVSDGRPVYRCLWIFPLSIGKQLIV